MNSRSKLMIPGILKALVCIAACLPVMLGGSGGLVLCFGQGGHIAIELAHDDAHHSPDDQSDDDSSEHPRVQSHEDCNSCFDIPLTVEKTDQLLFDKKVSRIAGLLACDSASSVPASAVRTDGDLSILAHQLSLPLPNFIEELRTTVLRT